MAAIRCQALTKHYPSRTGPVHAVNGLDLEIQGGECFGLLGPNGAGKTTTIEILEGLLAPTSGDVEVLGRHWGRHDDELRQRLGISLQETRFQEKLSVLEVLRLFRSFYRRGLEPDDVIASVGLTDKATAWVGKLSGGQRQRLAVACALIGDPELLFLDEPTTGLDPQSRRQIWDIVRAFARRGRTIVLTTHYMDEAERLCDRVAIVDLGRVIALGTPADLISSMGGAHVVEFACAPGAAIDTSELASLPSVQGVARGDADTALTVAEPHLAIPALLALLQARRLDLLRLTTRHVTLEDVFMHLTGKHLRDEDVSAA
jgi:ABC-2 type transport system ATP-binding protein